MKINNLAASANNFIQNINKSWIQRAQVRVENPYDQVMLYPEKPDFIESLLPFYTHAIWKNSDHSLKNNILSYAWVLYNLRTICVEDQIIAPVCHRIIRGEPPFNISSVLKMSVAQTVVDESFHTLLSLHGCETISNYRNLKPVPAEKFALISKLEESLANYVGDEYSQSLLYFAVAVTSETIISDYLALLSSSTLIQPFCKKITAIHRKDEMIHSGIFINILGEIFCKLIPEDKAFIIKYILEASYWFAAKDSELWLALLKMIEFPQADLLISESFMQDKYSWLHEHGKVALLVKPFIESLIAAGFYDDK